jgi:hypothetical protein
MCVANNIAHSMMSTTKGRGEEYELGNTNRNETLSEWGTSSYCRMLTSEIQTEVKRYSTMRLCTIRT